jgi:DNA-binding Lrp family transcriptional regulator
MSVKVYILIVTDPGMTRQVFEALSAAPNVTETREVMGPYDIVAEIEAPDLNAVPAILSAQVRTMPGIHSTTSLVAFPKQD